MKRVILIVCLLLSFYTIQAKGEPVMISEGKTVKFHYTLKVNGDITDTSDGKDPLQYVHGNKMIIPGLEKELEGLKVGDEKKVVISPEEGYGPINPQAVIEVPKTNLDPNVAPEVGMMMQMQTPQGQALPGIIKELKEEVIVVDFNHPLAGQELHFDVEIVEVN